MCVCVCVCVIAILSLVKYIVFSVFVICNSSSRHILMFSEGLLMAIKYTVSLF